MKFFGIIVFLAGFGVASAYDFIGRRPMRWADGDIPMNLQLDATMSPQILSDGKSSWNAVAEEALGLWNAQLGPVRFTTYTDDSRGDGNDQNEVFFSTQIYGKRFGRFVLAVTTAWRVGTRRVEADTIFNANIDWDSYRGDLDSSRIDLRRVAMHEFGHSLGLDHPDQANQVEVAVMNSRISDLDTIAEDDARGVRALYPPATSYTLNVEATAGGRVIASPLPDAGGRYAAGTVVKLTARPDRRNRLAAWSGVENRTGRILKVRVVGDDTVVANFSTNPAPAIVSQPAAQFAVLGDTVRFDLQATSGTPVQYQWQFDGAEIPGATSRQMLLDFVTHAHTGLYSCRVSNAGGATVSKAAQLVVDGY